MKVKKLAFQVLKKIKIIFSGRGFHKMPLIQHLYFFLYKLFKPTGIVLTNNKFGYKMYIDTEDIGIGHALLIDGIYHEFEATIFKKLIKEGMTVLDIGANNGMFTLLAASIVGREGKVFSFEPEPNNYDLLVRNVKLNRYDDIVTTVQKAVSNKTGKNNLYLCKNDKSIHSLYGLQSEMVEFVEAETISIDDFFVNRDNKVDVMKIVVQGCEVEVIEGARNIINANRNLAIMAEFAPIMAEKFGYSAEEYLKRFRNMGFSIYNVKESEKKIEKIDDISSFIKALKENKKGVKSKVPWRKEVANLLYIKGDENIDYILNGLK